MRDRSRNQPGRTGQQTDQMGNRRDPSRNFSFPIVQGSHRRRLLGGGSGDGGRNLAQIEEGDL